MLPLRPSDLMGGGSEGKCQSNLDTTYPQGGGEEEAGYAVLPEA
jgi:hypothetical protein